MMETYKKPLPVPAASTAPFWQAANGNRFELQFCARCETFQHYPREFCASCWGEDLAWRQCSGKGTVYSYSICSIPLCPGFAEDVPYVIAIVNLEEQVKMTTNIIGCEPADVHIGMEVEVVFDRVTESCTLLKFRPCRSDNP